LRLRLGRRCGRLLDRGLSHGSRAGKLEILQLRITDWGRRLLLWRRRGWHLLLLVLRSRAHAAEGKRADYYLPHRFDHEDRNSVKAERA
jgi:hypothetical protein